MSDTERRETRAAWDGVAAGFDEHTTPLAIPLAEAALRRVDIRPGLRFLDVAAGSGALSIPAARLGATVLATDVSPAMVERLEARALEEGLSDLEVRVMDGHALELADDSVDVSGSQNGVSLFPDVQRGLREMVRVTRPGGRVLVVAFGPPAEAEFITFFVSAMRAAVPGFDGLPMDPPPLPFQLADPGTLRERMADAGLHDVQVDTVAWEMEFQSAAHFWDVVTSSNPIAAELVADASQEQIAAVLAVLDDELRERSGGNAPAVLTTRTNVGVGTK